MASDETRMTLLHLYQRKQGGNERGTIRDGDHAPDCPITLHRARTGCGVRMDGSFAYWCWYLQPLGEWLTPVWGDLLFVEDL